MPHPSATADTSVLARLEANWRRRFLPFEPTDPDAPAWRARMVQTVVSFAPITMAANLLNAVTVAMLAGDRLALWETLVWLVFVGWTVISGTLAWLRTRHAPVQRASPRAINRLTVYAFLSSAAWGILSARLLPVSDPGMQTVILTVATGMVCAGGYVLAAVPSAGLVYVGTLGSALAAALAASTIEHRRMLLVLLCGYVVIICASLLHLSRTFAKRLVAETDAARQQQVVGLLLKDFEDHASDVLWEIDSAGHLRHASARLLSMLGVDETGQSEMPFRRLVQRLAAPTEAGTAQVQRLRRRFASVRPFSDLELPVRVHDETRWWSLTAKPLVSEDGHVSGWRGVISDITKDKTSHSALYKLAHKCPLTGLANRRHFLGEVARTLEQRGKSSSAILYMDLDNFKKVNDVHGHGLGDQLLQRIAVRIASGLRKGDIAARLGGDEFAILLHEIGSEEEAARFAGRLLSKIQPATKIGELNLPVGMSIGIAIAPKHGEAPDELMRAADLALYRAKSAGKGTVQIYSPQLGRASKRRAQLEESLRDAVEKRQLRVVYQPQVDVASGRIVAFEALVRWEHPELGLISPAEFIPIAEETGAIERLGNWVLETACRQAARWPQTIGIAVNVSPIQAMGEGLITSVRKALAESGLAVKRLELEITESIFLNENPRTMQVLHALRGLGVKIALDDFGVGYSSLGYLRRFPFSSLKIDRAFTGELATSDQARSIVKAIVALAECLGMTTIVEGVEHAAQLAVVRDTGCDQFQGYYCSEPVPADAIAQLIAGWNASRLTDPPRKPAGRRGEAAGRAARAAATPTAPRLAPTP
ncbi:MAG: putative bifunctional diguanylate cyclase/phosphodiesterase [Lautropia sp.]